MLNQVSENDYYPIHTSVCIYISLSIYLSIYIYIFFFYNNFHNTGNMKIKTTDNAICGGARGVIVIVVGNGHGDTGSNSERD